VQEPQDWVEIFTTVAEVIHGFSEVPEVFKLLVLCKGTRHDPRSGESKHCVTPGRSSTTMGANL